MTQPARTPQWCPVAALPAQLGELSIPVKGLWWLGDADVLAGDGQRFVAIVGTREASAYGIRMAQRLAAGAARAGLVVVSGLARGVDAAAHEAAVAAGGRTVAVLGTGVDVPYPLAHRTLHGLVQKSGAVLSEVEPGTRAFPGCFPRRNRIIAGLCGMTVVVEAGFKSGALHTAGVARDLGRTVGAVPGHADDPRAAGSNQLLRDGAQVILDVEDLLISAGFSTFPNSLGSESERLARLESELWTEEDRTILRLLGGEPRSIEALTVASGLSLRQVSEAALRLEICGALETTASGYRSRLSLATGQGVGGGS